MGAAREVESSLDPVELLVDPIEAKVVPRQIALPECLGPVGELPTSA